MLPRSEIHRSLATMTLDLHKMMRSRRNAAAVYQLAEREFQATVAFAGKLGTLPVEAKAKIHFSVTFLADTGLQRDSALDRPITRFGFEMTLVPPGAIPYAHVKSWKHDSDHNYTGAVVVIGMHCPAMYVPGATPPDDLSFKGLLHIAFQGFGMVTDDENTNGVTANPKFTQVQAGVG